MEEGPTHSVQQVTTASTEHDPAETMKSSMETALENLAEKLSEIVETKVNGVFAR